MELTLAMIWSCLMRVPVRHWRTLFHYLGRLDATFAEARADGRTWVNWHLREDGVIFVSEWDLTEDERKRRCALPDGFDATPWTRPALALDAPAPFCFSLHTASSAIALFLDHAWTAPAPLAHPAAAPLKPP